MIDIATILGLRPVPQETRDADLSGQEYVRTEEAEYHVSRPDCLYCLWFEPDGKYVV